MRHERGECLDAQQRAGDVDLAHPGEVGRVEVGEPGPPGDPRVGDEPVDPPVPLPQVRGESRPARRVGDVEPAVFDPEEVLGGRLGAVQADHGGALGREQTGLRGALALPGAGDDDDLPGHPAAHEVRFRFRGRG